MKHAIGGILWFARVLGWKGRDKPKMIAFSPKKGFSKHTAFILSAKGDGYYQTTLDKCSCPDHEFRHHECKHQKMLAKYLGTIA